MPMMAAISMMVVLPNHMRKFISATSVRAPKVDSINRMASPITPMLRRMLLTGPELENMAKNSMAKAEAMMRLGR